jgi:hypothetical protein
MSLARQPKVKSWFLSVRTRKLHLDIRYHLHPYGIIDHQVTNLLSHSQ